MMFILYWVVFCSLIFFCSYDGRKRYQEKCIKIFYSYIIILVFYATFKDADLVADAKTYIEALHGREIILEPSFNWIARLVNTIGGQPVLLFFIYSLVAITVKAKAILHISALRIFSLIIWVADLYPLHELAQIRVAVAGAFFLLALPALYNRNLKQYFLFTLLATLFHFSGIIMLGIWFLSRDRINPVIWSVLLIISFIWAYLRIDVIRLVTYIPIEGVEEKYNAYLAIQNRLNQPPIFSLLVLGKLIITLFILMRLNIIRRYNCYSVLMAKIMMISIIARAMLATNVSIAFRVSEFFSVVEIAFIPLLYYIVKPKWFGYFGIVLIATIFAAIRIFSNHLIN